MLNSASTGGFPVILRKTALVFASTLLLLTPILGQSAVAQSATSAEGNADAPIAIDMSELTTTKNEIAVLQVLSEICPTMLPKNQQAGFANAYNNELKKLMPTISSPKQAIQYLSTQQDYKKILADTRAWTLNYPTAENKEICTDLAKYHYNSQGE